MTETRIWIWLLHMPALIVAVLVIAPIMQIYDAVRYRRMFVRK